MVARPDLREHNGRHMLEAHDDDLDPAMRDEDEHEERVA
jgi:hypothetical protein